jgi:DNA-binding NarL/FixJ family response regulator
MPRILLIDRHGVYRRGLRLGLQVHLPGSQIVEAENLQDAQKSLDPDGSFDLLLMDIDEPDSSFELLRSLRQSHPRTRLVALSGNTDRASILQSLESGLFGFISKSQSDAEIFSAIKDILSGRIYVPLFMAQPDEQAVSPLATRHHHHYINPATADRELRPERLTPRQRQILPLLARGMSNKEIARALKIAEGTTKIHASGLLRVLGVRNRTEAAVVARDYINSEQMASAHAIKEACAAPRRR